jgi:hypothetical protein
MDSSPFVAKVRDVGLQIIGYQLELAQAEADGTHQLHLPSIAQ